MPEDKKPSEKVVPVLKDLLTVFDIVASNRYMTLASQKEIDVYVIYMTYRVQQDLYQVCQESGLLDQGKDFLWQEYLNELEQKGPIWDQVYAAFQDALARLNFKPVWKSEHLEELIRRADMPEV